MANALIVLIGVSLTGAQEYQLPAAPQKAPQVVIAPTVSQLTTVAGRGLKDVPNIEIKYYDVSGKNYAALVQSIEKQRPRDAATNQLMAGGASWSLGASMTQRTVNKVCSVTGAKAEFAATAELPRLVNEQALAPAQLAAWRAYLSSIEVPAAAGLWFVLDRIPAFEKSFVGKDCATAAAFGGAAIEQLKQDHAAFQARSAPPVPAAPAKK